MFLPIKKSSSMYISSLKNVSITVEKPSIWSVGFVHKSGEVIQDVFRVMFLHFGEDDPQLYVKLKMHKNSPDMKKTPQLLHLYSGLIIRKITVFAKTRGAGAVQIVTPVSEMLHKLLDMGFKIDKSRNMDVYRASRKV